MEEIENNRYHAKLIRQLAQVGKMPIGGDWFEIVNGFLKTTTEITNAQTVSIYQYEEEGFQQIYSYNVEIGPVRDTKAVKLRKEQFFQWIQCFSKQDYMVVGERKNLPQEGILEYEKIYKNKIESMIAFRLTHNGELSGCMILENPELEKCDTFIELIPLIDVFLGNVRKNHRNEKARKISEDILNENKQELQRERKFLEVLSRDYTTIYHLDLINNTLEPLKLTKDANASQINTVKIREKIDYTEHMKFYCKEYVASRNQEELVQMMQISNLFEILSNNSRFVYRYESKPNKSGHRYFELQLIRLNEEKFDGNALMAFRHIDDIITQEQKRHQELEEALEKERINNEILSAIGKIYYAIFRINLEQDIYEEISSKEEVHHLTGKSGCASKEMMEICKTFVVPEYQERIQKFFDLDTLGERLKNEDTIAAEYLAKDGNWHTARFIVKRRNKQGKATHVLYVTQLISDTKRREQNWIAIAEDANKANEAKSEFISQIAHDIRTPMNAIFGFLEIARANLSDQEKVEYCLKKIQQAGDFMKELVTDVLDISRMEHGKMKLHPESIGLTDMINEFSTAMVHMKMDKKLEIHTEIHDILHDQIIVDSLRIKQIYSNILSNAIKYTKDGGRVDFEVYQEELKGTQKVRLIAIVSDTGIGMSKDYMKKMYAKFSRETDTRINKVNGYGLGLSIVYQLVNMMKGTIEVESELGKGTTFYVKIDLPYIDMEAKKENIRTDQDAKEELCQGLHILIAEDNDLNYEVIKELLAMHQITCERAEDGIICIEKFKNATPHTYDAILMDMQMPNMNGVEATKNIRKLNKRDAVDLPIIAMTANTFKEDIQECMNAGMDEYLEKPIDTKKLLRVLQRFCRK